jgi:hypothetical protein
VSYKRTPKDNCRDCGKPMTDHTKSSLGSGRCRSCYNDWFSAWLERSAENGTLTGARAHLNKPNYKKLLAWPVPA